MRFRRKPPPAVTPQSLLDAAYDERLLSLERIRAASAVVHASRARLEASRRAWLASVERHENEARAALAAGDEGKARAAAARCVPIDADIGAADAALVQFQETENDLGSARDIVAQQLNALRRRRDALRGARATGAALAAVQADLATLDRAFEPVVKAIKNPN